MQSASLEQMELRVNRRPDQFQNTNTGAGNITDRKYLHDGSLRQRNTNAPLPLRHNDSEAQGDRQDYTELQVSGQLQQSDTYVDLNTEGKKSDFSAPSLYYNVSLQGASNQDEDLYEELPSEA